MSLNVHPAHRMLKFVSKYQTAKVFRQNNVFLSDNFSVRCTESGYGHVIVNMVCIVS